MPLFFVILPQKLMFNKSKYCKEIFKKLHHRTFEELAISAFFFQYTNNYVYRQFCDLLKINPSDISKLSEIPFLPTSFFKTHKVLSDSTDNLTVFSSSTTTGTTPSQHFVSDLNLYKDSFRKSFELFYGAPENFTILALLPSYLEREGSSLILMVEELIKMTGKKESGFFLYDFESLALQIKELELKKEKYILLGVSFALLDFAENYPIKITHGIVMETGGMKGRRKELTRSELHTILQNSFGVSSIHSEYGMTELLSQAYSNKNGQYECPPWMKVLVRDTTDPRSINLLGTGALNIIDLANINSCCFIETADLGNVDNKGIFSVSGRFDSAEVRGCNLMIQ
jgi:phenylacetate-coenzyme A ligase PaaK-like adenylate-forming protein